MKKRGAPGAENLVFTNSRNSDLKYALPEELGLGLRLGLGLVYLI